MRRVGQARAPRAKTGQPQGCKPAIGRRPFGLFGALALAIGALSGCGAGPETAVVLEVDRALSPAQALDLIEFRVIFHNNDRPCDRLLDQPTTAGLYEAIGRVSDPNAQVEEIRAGTYAVVAYAGRALDDPRVIGCVAGVRITDGERTEITVQLRLR